MRGSLWHLSLATVVALAGLGAGCVTEHQSAVCDVDPFGWETPAEIVFTNTDTLSTRDAALFLRCDERFEEDTLTVRIASVTPDSLRFEEDFRLHIRRPKEPAALTPEAVIPYRQRIRLAREGAYHWFVTPCRPVRGIEAVGIHLTDND